MSISSGPKIKNTSLLLNLDAANLKNTQDVIVTNTIKESDSINPYNNPGFIATSTKTKFLFKGAPVYKITFSPQDAAKAIRLGSSEGFGAYHNLGTALYPNKKYMSSIYFKTNRVLKNGFSNTYSNIGGWGYSNTGTTRYEEDGWLRLYTSFYNTTTINNISYATGTIYDQFYAIFNTTATTDVEFYLDIAANGAYTTTTPYGTLSSGSLSSLSIRKVILGFNPQISNANGIVGLSTGTSAMISHGLDTTNWTKISSASPFYTNNFPLRYYIKVRIPSTGGVNKTVSFYPIFSMGSDYVTDNKYWKITFDETKIAAGDIIETYWAAPMFEETDRLFPTPFINGSGKNKILSTSWPDITKNNRNGTLFNGPLFKNDNKGCFYFDGTDDYLSTPDLFSSKTLNNWTVNFWIKPSTGGWLISPGSHGYDHYIYYDSTNKKIRVAVIQFAEGAEYNLNGTNNSVPLNIWTNVSISINDLDIKIFINGKLNASATATAGYNAVWSGIWRWCQRSTGQFSMQAYLSEIKIYEGVLNSSEILQIFEASRNRYNI